MSKSNVFQNKAFERTSDPGLGFNVVAEVNGFNSIFEVRPLDKREANQIEKLLADSYQPGELQEDRVKYDVGQIKQITAEIRAIGRQGVVLMGERVSRAKEILKPYRNGTFTKWLESTFGAKKTGYNVLAYFELYTQLSNNDLRDRFKKIPLRAAYVLASRPGSHDVKEEIVREYHELGHGDLVNLIQDKLPPSIADKRSKISSNDRYVNQILEMLTKLKIRNETLSEKNKRDLSQIKKMVELLLS